MSSAAPIRPPGTHTNAEVKAALHARARRRSYGIAALVVLLFAAVLVIYNTAQEYEDEDQSSYAPKMVLLVASELSYGATVIAKNNQKMPFLRQLTAAGGAFGKLSAKYSVTSGSAFVKLLTGSATTSAITLDGQTSFLSTLKQKGFKTAIVAPTPMFSSGSNGVCTRFGFFDTECTGDSACFTGKTCNTDKKIMTCSGDNELFSSDVIRGFEEAVQSGSDFILINVEGFRGDVFMSEVKPPLSNVLQRYGNINMLDNLVGQIALSLSKRTSTTRENWMITMTSEGQNRVSEAPYFSTVYSKGLTARVRNVSPSARTVDVLPTILQWFGISTSSDAIGICTNGKALKNC